LFVANDVLSDPAKRRTYDSQEEFDDSLPNASTITPENFYAVFAEVFSRNAKWAVSKNVPTIGTASKPYPQVIEFYEFWRKFSSWRDYPGDDEYDVENAETREEKRWMARQNSKAREKWRREERQRISSLVGMS
jgi:DnaJ homolog subfamily C member 2